MSLLGDAQVEAAAEAMEDAALTLLGRDLGTIHRNAIARAALSAALPLIETQLREQIAQELETCTLNVSVPLRTAELLQVASVTRRECARVVRGTTNQESTDQ